MSKAKKLNSVRKFDLLGRHQMIEDDEPDDRERHREQRAERTPHPGPECQGQKYQKRIERQPAADDGRGDEMSFRGGDAQSARAAR